MIPKYFSYEILEKVLVSVLGGKESETIMALIPRPTERDRKVNYVLDLIHFVNSDNRYKLCVVNRRTDKWAIFLLTPYGIVRTQELSYAFGMPYDSQHDSVIMADIHDLADALEELGFNSTVIVNAFVDCYDQQI